MIINELKYSYNDITIVPETISYIDSRSKCNPFVDNNGEWLPIFASPMASVVNEKNMQTFIDNGIVPILPRNINIECRIKQMNEQQWVALSLKEFEDLFIDNYLNRIDDFRTHYFIVIDIANGHMKSLYEKCRKAKELARDNDYKLTIMTGNIANPKTYEWICNYCFIKNKHDQYECSIDYIRVGIGGGSGCITTSNVSIHYPQASLIDECFKIKKSISVSRDYCPKIVADGGIRNYDHVIKALALGADYVMIGSLFAQCIESAGIKANKELNHKMQLRLPIERYKDFSVDNKGNWSAYYIDDFIAKSSKSWKDEVDKYAKDPIGDTTNLYLEANRKYKERLKSLKEKKYIGGIDVKFFGMASADGQKAIDGEKKKTAEGITKWLPVKYTLSGWVENMISYLRSAMSYTNAEELKDFIGSPKIVVNSISEINSVNK